MNEEIAWAAGFFEGEGYCAFRNRTLMATVSQADREPLDLLQRIFGGKVYGPYRTKNPLTKRESYRWQIHGEAAKSFLDSIKPWLFTRRQKQVESSLAAYEDRPQNAGWRSAHAANAARTPEEHSEIVRRGWETRRANLAAVLSRPV